MDFSLIDMVLQQISLQPVQKLLSLRMVLLCADRNCTAGILVLPVFVPGGTGNIYWFSETELRTKSLVLVHSLERLFKASNLFYKFPSHKNAAGLGAFVFQEYLE